MRFNRFLTGTNNNSDSTDQMVVNRFKPNNVLRNNLGKASSMQNTNMPTCEQVSEEPVDADLFIIDVLELFFKERLSSVSLNDALRQTAALAVEQANQILPTADAVPRPANGRANVTWLTSDAVQRAFRKAQNKCLYLNIRAVIYQRLRAQYERDKDAATPLASGQSYLSNSFGVNNLTISQTGIDLIKRFEGFRANLYNDVAGHCTIGYGTLVHKGNCDGRPSETAEFRAGINDARATELLMTEINRNATVVNARVEVVLNQNQFDALVSFVYNFGAGAFIGSTLLRELNLGNYNTVPSELRKWINAGGRPVQGLINRRNDEIALFNTPVSNGSGTGTSTAHSLSNNNNQRPCGCQQHEPTYNRGMNVPRGIRNNNPGNIEMNDRNAWEGKVPRAQNTDGRFEQFTSYAYGVRALIILLRNYINNGRNTLTTIFGAYAPPSENNTQGYIRFVSERIGIDANSPVPLTRGNIRAIAQAIARMENGQEAITDTQFDEGWALLPPTIANSIGQSMFSNAYQDTPFFDVRTCAPDAAFNTTWTNIKQQIVTTARAEYDFWTRPDRRNWGRYAETDPYVTQRLKDYWAAVGVHPTTAQIHDPVWQLGTPENDFNDGHPWSAVFISYVMEQAGATPSFTKGQRHTIYAYAAKQNADNRNFDNPFWLCRVNNALPEPGDLVVKNRPVRRRVDGVSRSVMGNITYDSLTTTGKTHSDIVTAVDYTAGTITVIGGNAHGESVNTSTYNLNGDGTINTTRHPEVFAILKLRTDKCETCGTTAVV